MAVNVVPMATGLGGLPYAYGSSPGDPYGLLTAKPRPTPGGQLMAAAVKNEPVYSRSAGLAKVLAGGLGGVLQGLEYKRALEQYAKTTAEINGSAARAYGLGPTAGASTGTPTGSTTSAPNPFAGDLGTFAKAIQNNESGGNYAALGPVTKNGDRAYGAYGVMGNNIPGWTKEALGRSMTPDEFLNDTGAQDAVFSHQFGKALAQYGNPQDAASVWFTGRPLAQGAGSSDVLGTTGAAYVDRFNRTLALTGGAQPQPDATADATPPSQGDSVPDAPVADASDPTGDVQAAWAAQLAKAQGQVAGLGDAGVADAAAQAAQPQPAPLPPPRPADTGWAAPQGPAAGIDPAQAQAPAQMDLGDMSPTSVTMMQDPGSRAQVLANLLQSRPDTAQAGGPNPQLLAQMVQGGPVAAPAQAPQAAARGVQSGAVPAAYAQGQTPPAPAQPIPTPTPVSGPVPISVQPPPAQTPGQTPAPAQVVAQSGSQPAPAPAPAPAQSGAAPGTLSANPPPMPDYIRSRFAEGLRLGAIPDPRAQAAAQSMLQSAQQEWQTYQQRDFEARKENLDLPIKRQTADAATSTAAARQKQADVLGARLDFDKGRASPAAPGDSMVLPNGQIVGQVPNKPVVSTMGDRIYTTNPDTGKSVDTTPGNPAYNNSLVASLGKAHTALADNVEAEAEKVTALHSMQGAIAQIIKDGGSTGPGGEQMLKLQGTINSVANLFGIEPPANVADKEDLRKFGMRLAAEDAKMVGGAKGGTNFEMKTFVNANPGIETSPTFNVRAASILEQRATRNLEIGRNIRQMTADAVANGGQVSPSDVEKMIRQYDAEHHITDPITGQDLTKTPELPEFKNGHVVSGKGGGQPAPGQPAPQPGQQGTPAPAPSKQDIEAELRRRGLLK